MFKIKVRLPKNKVVQMAHMLHLPLAPPFYHFISEPILTAYDAQTLYFLKNREPVKYGRESSS